MIYITLVTDYFRLYPITLQSINLFLFDLSPIPIDFIRVKIRVNRVN